MLKDGYEYQIQRSDGLFSTGGYWPRFSKRGKIWRTIGHLKIHLRNVTGRHSIYPERHIKAYEDCVVVKYVVSRVLEGNCGTPYALIKDVK
jgi:hypothetical protein